MQGMRVWVGLRLAHARCLLLEAQDRLQTYGVLSRHDVRQHLHELLTNPLCARPTPAKGPQKPALESCAAVLQCEVRFSAVSMVVRLAAALGLASVRGHGRAADTADQSHPQRDTRPGRITGPRRGRRTPPW